MPFDLCRTVSHILTQHQFILLACFGNWKQVFVYCHGSRGLCNFCRSFNTFLFISCVNIATTPSKGKEMTELKMNEDAEETVTAKILRGIRCIKFCSLPAKFDAVLINWQLANYYSVSSPGHTLYHTLKSW